MRDPATTRRVTNIELFFDLVYVFAHHGLAAMGLHHLGHQLARSGSGNAPASAMILGGVGLFLAGHAAFKAVIWLRVSWPRLGALAVLGLLGLAAPHVTALALGACTAVVILAVAVPDYARNRRLPGEGAGSRPRRQRPRRKTPDLPLPVLPLPEAT